MPRVSQQRAAFCECGDHAFLAMKMGVALVDPANAPLIEGRGWSVNSDGYAYNKHLGKLHRVVSGASGRTEHVDHISHDKLDNRAANLRLCNIQLNQFNKKPKPGGQSAYKGVGRLNGKWSARIAMDRNRQYLGTFDDEAGAARAYDAAAVKLFGEFAYLNFPEGF